MSSTALIESLQSIRRRVRFLSVLFGVGIVLAAAVGLLVATVLLDYLLNLQAIPRLLLMMAALVGMGYVIVRWLINPLLSRLSIGDVARWLERAFPQFDDRLRSTVDFVHDDVPGSAVMKDRVVTETTDLSQQVDLNQALVKRPVWYSLAAGAGALVFLMALVMVIQPQYLSIAMSRLMTPFSGEAWPKRQQIEIVGTVPDRVPVGQRVDVQMRLVRGDRDSMRAVAFYQYGDGPVQQQYMTRGEDGTFGASLDARAAANEPGGRLNVWMRAGDDEKALDAITVVPRLSIREVEAVVTPPAYADRPPATVNLGSMPATTTIGSDVSLRVIFNKPLAEDEAVQVLPAAENVSAPEIQWDAANGQTVVGSWSARESVRFNIRATDIDGFENSALEEYELIVRPDQPPTVQIENPRRNEDRTPVAMVPLQVVADDDYGIESMKLVVTHLGDQKQWEIDLVAAGAPLDGVSWQRIDAAGDRERYRMNYDWELSELDSTELRSGDVLEYYVEVEDNFNLDGETHPPVQSGTLRINIISQDAFATQITQDLRAVANHIQQVRNTQNRTRQETSTLAEETSDLEEMDSGHQAAADRISGQQGSVASQTMGIVGDLEEVQQRMDENRSPAQELRDLADDVSRILAQTAENPMRDASDAINRAREDRQGPELRNQSFDQADASQQEASENLDRALSRMDNIGSLREMIGTFQNILEQQLEISRETREIGEENIGRTPEQMSDEDRERLEAATESQSDLAEATENALERMRETAEDLSQSDPEASQAMSRAADTGQQQQVAPNQQRAAEQARQNQQGQAQAAQQQVEIGLEMIINQLREAERRKLEALARQLLEIEEQIANLVRQQAGHNLNNLELQGDDVIRELSEVLIRELAIKAQRDLDADHPTPDLRQLGTAQARTESNTRDIARTVEEIPAGAEPAGYLIRAAGRMERAIVHMREQDLARAYDPAKVDALAALEEALRIIREQLAQAQAELEQMDRDSIRDAYTKILEGQEAVNATTREIEESPRRNGQFLRDALLRLRQLPGRQGELADDTGSLESALTDLGGLVYVWANRDIVRSMNEVKDDLAKPETGVATQAEQFRIAEQLQAMIDSLAIEPLEERFEQEGGGGGDGGECPFGLPSEAELRLLKALQEAVNRSTQTIDAEADRDERRLVALGGRQGELRGLLDELMNRSSGGQVRLGPELDPRDQLPEEATVEQVEDQELEHDLLNLGDVGERVQRDIGRIGDRMARSRQRLALDHDPGQTTQLIQERILEDLDDLIEMARQQQAQQMAQQQAQGQQRMQAQQQGGDPQDQQGTQTQQQGGSEAAQDSTAPGPGDTTADMSGDIEGEGLDWGGISPRDRDAVIEGRQDAVIEKYRDLVEQYYRSLSTQGSQRR